MRILVAIVLMMSALAGGCASAGFTPAPYDGRLSCEAIGGTYTADGRCLAGNA